MKRIYPLLLFSLIFNAGLFSQTAGKKNTSAYRKPAKFYVSKPLRDFPDAKPVKESDKKEALDKFAEKYKKAGAKFKPHSFLSDPIVQRRTGTIALDTPIVNFDGIPGTYFPPDPSGAVSPFFFVQANNIQIAVYDKSGNTIMAPKDLGYLWDSTEVGDPVILYDKFADRWFVSQIEADPSWTYWNLCVGVSTTNDPTGSYYVYDYYFDTVLPDYPKYSIWPDGYYCTCQFFPGPEEILVLERNRMLKGDPSAGIISDSLPSSHPFGGNNRISLSPKTLNCDGALPPYGSPNFLFFFEDVNSGGASNSIIIYKLATDTTLKTITPTIYDSLPTAPFSAYFTGGSQNDIAQPGVGHILDALDGPFNFRVPYMRFTGYNSVVLSNTVNLGGLVAGVRWYELRQNDTTQKWIIYQQGTYGPNDGVSRWNSSICMNNNGDISLAYTVADSVSLYPGIRYTGRLAGDTLGQMSFTEQTAVAGGSSFSFGRWGDYSESTLDPSDGITFWHTNEYVGNSNNEMTRVFSFKLNKPSGIQTLPQTEAQLKVYEANGMINVLATSIPTDESVVINLFDINGKQLTSEWVKPQGGKVVSKINAATLASGTYLVRIGNVKFQVVKKVIVSHT